MSVAQSYMCPCCGAQLLFTAETQNLSCEACGNEFSAETLKQLSDDDAELNSESKYDWETYTQRSYEPEEEVNISKYFCRTCGAEIEGDASLGATFCPWCGNATIVEGQFEGNLRPDYIIPFKVKREDAIKAFEADFKHRPFLPDTFKDFKRIKEAVGIYVPFWVFDCDCNASLSYKATRMSVWSDANYNYTKTDHYRLFRSGSIGFANIPVDGSKKADDAYMEALEPFDYSQAVEFNGTYLSGFMADRYDVSAEESIPRANERVKNSTIAAFNETTGRYTGVIPESSRVEFSDGKIRYSLLPVWMLNIKYMDKTYKFAVNGQTGKVVGVYPVDKGKKWRFFAKVAGIAYAVAAVIAFLLLR